MNHPCCLSIAALIVYGDSILLKKGHQKVAAEPLQLNNKTQGLWMKEGFPK